MELKQPDANQIPYDLGFLVFYEETLIMQTDVNFSKRNLEQGIKFRVIIFCPANTSKNLAHHLT